MDEFYALYELLCADELHVTQYPHNNLEFVQTNYIFIYIQGEYYHRYCRLICAKKYLNHELFPNAAIMARDAQFADIILDLNGYIVISTTNEYKFMIGYTGIKAAKYFTAQPMISRISTKACK